MGGGIFEPHELFSFVTLPLHFFFPKNVEQVPDTGSL